MKNIKNKDKKKKILYYLKNNKMKFHMNVQNGQHITNNNIDKYPDIKKSLLRNIKYLYNTTNDLLLPQEASKQFLKIFENIDRG